MEDDMTDDRRRPERDDPSHAENNPLGLGTRGPEGSNTGSITDTQYDAVNSDPYTTGEPAKDLRTPAGEAASETPPPKADGDQVH